MAYTNRRRGMGDYDRVSNWNWLYYPPPYAFANPNRPQPKAPPEFYAPAATMGLGCGGCGGKCASCSAPGLGLFDTGLDVSGWGLGEWAVVAGAVVVGAAVFGKGKRTVRTRRAIRRVKGF